jgi:hypothetical protein
METERALILVLEHVGAFAVMGFLFSVTCSRTTLVCILAASFSAFPIPHCRRSSSYLQLAIPTPEPEWYRHCCWLSLGRTQSAGW